MVVSGKDKMTSNYQKVVWEQNQSKILQLLNEQPLTFKQIIEKSSLSRSVVNEHLKVLEEQGLIKKEYKDSKLLNMLTEKGRVMAVSEEDVKEQEIIEEDFLKAEAIFHRIVKEKGRPGLDARPLLFTLCLIYVKMKRQGE